LGTLGATGGQTFYRGPRHPLAPLKPPLDQPEEEIDGYGGKDFEKISFKTIMQNATRKVNKRPSYEKQRQNVGDGK